MLGQNRGELSRMTTAMPPEVEAYIYIKFKRAVSMKLTIEDRKAINTVAELEDSQ